MTTSSIRTLAISGAAAVAIAAAWAMGSATADKNTTTAAPAAFGQAAQGQAPQGAPPGMGAQVSDATAGKVAKAALSRYKGQIERVMQLPDGSYLAHVITSSGEVHVAVSKDFQVTGTEQGGGPPPGAAPQSGTAPGTTTS